MVLEVMTAEMRMDDAQTVMVLPVVVVEVRVDERRAQGPALQGERQCDRGQASKHERPYCTYWNILFLTGWSARNSCDML